MTAVAAVMEVAGLVGAVVGIALAVIGSTVLYWYDRVHDLFEAVRGEW